MNQKQLKETLIKNNLLYWAAGRNVTSINIENSIKKKFDKGWDPFSLLTFRIFLLFETCIRLKRERRNFIGLPRGTTFVQMYEKGVKELQVQLTTYWDYITVEEFKHKCPDLMDDWSCNAVNQLMNLKSVSPNSYCEMSLVVGHEGHCIYLSLCKTLDYVLVRVDNRWMDTVPLNTPHSKNGELIQPYLVAYFKSNDLDIDKNKEWLKEYIKNATILKDSNSNESMMHLYCSDINNPPREGKVLSIVEYWPYRPIQTDAQNCCLRSHNVGYRVRLGSVIYEWFRDQECKSFVFKKRNYNAIFKENTMKSEKSNEYVPSPSETLSHTELMKVLSKQWKVRFDEMYNGMALKQALVAKANIRTIQNEAFYHHNESTNQTYFQLYLNSTERIQFRQFYQSNFPKFIQSVKEIDHEWVQFYFDFHAFQCEVIPSLSSLF
ncbi:hypothetical protein RFI_02785 [Reticulomyxa filosa]|uniref:Uncharacterized protein n=1 Tax=Reticulomyxa filosa TaxID=46433 RepID=X6P8A8_RETFI|nr:hypothetical protein RFI_02785 [Reticulomyxa filosa]|eukprot:ETO34309.1 hypothetical protein RFI_02785 [Reticulomyxa filosa]